MKPLNETRITFPSRSSNEAFARSVVAAFVASADPTVEELSDIRTAVSEAVTNCIVHAYQDGIGPITLHIKMYDEGRLVLRIRDRGCGIENISRAMEPLFTTGGEDRSGLGFTVMESFTDKVQVRSTVGKGTTVTLEKRLLSRRNATTV